MTSPASPSLRRWLLIGCSAAALSACLLGGLALTALQFTPQFGGLPMGYTVLACANVSTQPSLSLQASWIMPQLMSSIIPTPPLLRGCVYLPWAPFLPPSGYWRFPP
ncbi:MAG: hypothetical protein JNK29_05295 [Anaerolineales bacterium]|nr:hypothetical protein [Anaerolineales bacterium]